MTQGLYSGLLPVIHTESTKIWEIHSQMEAKIDKVENLMIEMQCTMVVLHTTVQAVEEEGIEESEQGEEIEGNERENETFVDRILIFMKFYTIFLQSGSHGRNRQNIESKSRTLELRMENRKYRQKIRNKDGK